MTTDTTPALPLLPDDDAAAFMYPSDLEEFQRKETTAEAVSVSCTNVDTRERTALKLLDTALQSIASDRAAREGALNEGTIAIARSLAKKLRGDMESGVRPEIRAQMFVTARFLETLAAPRGEAAAQPGWVPSLALIDQAFEDEIKRVSSVHYDSNAICRHFFGEFRKRLSALAAVHSPASDRAALDHRALLVKYMRHVVQEEGCDFLLAINAGQSSDVKFTGAEIVELRRIAQEANPEGYPL